VAPATTTSGRAAAGAARAEAKAPSGPPPGVSSRSSGERTRARIIDAALETLRDEGFAGTTARAIAKRGGFNAALIFYHFGGVNELLLSALDHSSAQRMARYREALAGITTVTELLTVMRKLYAEDAQTPHITAVRELIASGTFSQELGPELIARMQPWVDFAHEVIDRLLGDAPLRRSVDTRDVAFALIALYLGSEQVSRLQGDTSRIDSLFATARRMAPMLDDLLGHPAQRAPRTRRAQRVPIEG
jgi:AcrR family transcriptional regulator